MAIPEHLIVACRTCRSPVGHRCRTLKTKRSTDTHTDRIVDAARERAARANGQTVTGVVPTRRLYLVR